MPCAASGCSPRVRCGGRRVWRAARSPRPDVGGLYRVRTGYRGLVPSPDRIQGQHRYRMAGLRFSKPVVAAHREHAPPASTPAPSHRSDSPARARSHTGAPSPAGSTRRRPRRRGQKRGIRRRDRLSITRDASTSRYRCTSTLRKPIMAMSISRKVSTGCDLLGRHEAEGLRASLLVQGRDLEVDPKGIIVGVEDVPVAQQLGSRLARDGRDADHRGR